MGRSTYARVAVRAAIAYGRSIDWVDQNVIERSSLTTPEKGALYLYAFALLPAAEQKRIVREAFALARPQIAALN